MEMEISKWFKASTHTHERNDIEMILVRKNFGAQHRARHNLDMAKRSILLQITRLVAMTNRRTDTTSLMANE